jgi:WD40 repeat protein
MATVAELALGSADNTASVLDTRTGARRFHLTGLHSGSIYSVAWSPYSFRLILAETKKLKKSLQNMYTRNFLRGILSSIAFASVRDRVCALLRNILENY